MNLWNCQADGCKSTAVGVGGAVGLRAVGWWFRTGPTIFCPAHRPDGIDGHGRYFDCEIENCAQCAAQQEADKWQAIIKESK